MDHREKSLRIEAAIDRALQEDGPLIIGPWTGEVGYELLYWVPFVRWVLTTRAVRARPVVVVSRGGVESWYAGIGHDRYIDAFSVMSPAELSALSEGGKPKQSATSGDVVGDAVLERVMAREGWGRVSRLLPHWMYRLYRPYWDGDVGIDDLAARARWSRVVPPSLGPVADVGQTAPVALRFYFSWSFPETEPNVAFARALIERLARAVPVVLLSHPFAIDDHQDFDPATASVRSVADLMTPETNLAVQTAVIGGARAFVGTYGGLSLLPPLCGVPSYAYCSLPFMKPSHEVAIARMRADAGGAPLLIGGIDDGHQQAERILRDLGYETGQA